MPRPFPCPLELLSSLKDKPHCHSTVAEELTLSYYTAEGHVLLVAWDTTTHLPTPSHVQISPYLFLSCSPVPLPGARHSMLLRPPPLVVRYLLAPFSYIQDYPI